MEENYIDEELIEENNNDEYYDLEAKVSADYEYEEENTQEEDKNKKEKRADNEQIVVNKAEIDKLTEEIEITQNGIETLENAKYDIIGINTQFEKCCDMVGNSLKGEGINRYITTMIDDNYSELKKINVRIDEKKERLGNYIKELENKKEKLNNLEIGSEANAY